MAQCKSKDFVHLSNDPIFNETYSPGDPAPISGIYLCQGCPREIVALHGQPLPPNDHHQHKEGRKPVAWQLIVTTSS